MKNYTLILQIRMFLHSLVLNREKKHLFFFFKSIEASMLNPHEFT